MSTKKYIKNLKLARIGKPSDWLISSKVENNKEGVNNSGIKIIDISMDEFMSEVDKNFYEEDEYTHLFNKIKFDNKQKNKALNIYGALIRLVKKYSLDGLTIRCYDLVYRTKATACVALSLLNAWGIHAACEGDLPSLISMAIAHHLTGQAPFLANPSIIKAANNSVIFAHCSAPFNTPSKITLDTHYESGQGVAIKAKFNHGSATIFKCNNLLNRYFISKGKIVENPGKSDLCRTQVKINLDKDVSYFFNNPLGNHHIVINGDYSNLLNSFMKDFC